MGASVIYLNEAMKVADVTSKFFDAAYKNVTRQEANYRFLLREFGRSKHANEMKCGSGIVDAISFIEPFQEFKKEFETIKNEVTQAITALQEEQAEALALGSEERKEWKLETRTLSEDPNIVAGAMIADGEPFHVPPMKLPKELLGVMRHFIPSSVKDIDDGHKAAVAPYVAMAKRAIKMVGPERAKSMALSFGLTEQQIEVVSHLLEIK